jgi:hypothetical protein
VRLDEVFDYGQTKATAPYGTRATFIYSIEALKKTSQMFFLDAFTVIRYANQTSIFVQPINSDLSRP